MKIKNDILYQNRIFAWIALGTGLILSILWSLMQLTDEADWKLGDFIIMGGLISGISVLFVLVARILPSRYRIIAGIISLAIFLLTWAHLAVGIVDSWPFAGS